MSDYPAFPELSRAFALRQGEAMIDPTLRDPYENGMESARARFTRVRRTFSMAISLIGEADKLALDAFVEDRSAAGAGFGAQPFTITDPRYQINPQIYTVRFASLPKYDDAGWVGADDQTPAGYRWNCTFQVREL